MAGETVLAFDVDGTLESSGGPVRVDKLLALQARGFIIVIVSESPNFPKDERGESIFERIIGTGSRLGNLLAVKERYPGRRFYYYTSDNPGDPENALEAGFIFVEPHEFQRLEW